MEIEKVFCLFEQSGTFKNVFRKYGIQARDFDILDDFTKPTQFFFVNCEPEQNVVMIPIQRVEKVLHVNPSNMKNDKSVQVKRSMMHPQFAERFIQTYILTKDGGLWI